LRVCDALNRRQRRIEKVIAYDGLVPSEPRDLSELLTQIEEPPSEGLSETEKFMLRLVLGRGNCMNSGLDSDVISEVFVQCIGGKIAKARIACFGCAVRAACEVDASERGVDYGVQGGLSQKERGRQASQNSPQQVVIHRRNIVDLALESIRQQEDDEYQKQTITSIT
jgi:hypothetical protein